VFILESVLRIRYFIKTVSILTAYWYCLKEETRYWQCLFRRKENIPLGVIARGHMFQITFLVRKSSLFSEQKQRGFKYLKANARQGRCLTFADCRLQTTDYRSQTAYSRPQTVNEITRRWLGTLKTTELNWTQIMTLAT